MACSCAPLEVPDAIVPTKFTTPPALDVTISRDDVADAAAEVGHHLRRETVARNVTTMTRTYRAYAATLLGDYLDIRGQRTARTDLYASNRYDAPQKFGEEVRARSGAGLLYDGLRRRTGVNVAAQRPHNIMDIEQQIISRLRCWQRRARSTYENWHFDRTIAEAIGT